MYTLHHTTVQLGFAPPSGATVDKEAMTVTFHDTTWGIETWTTDHRDKISLIYVKEIIPNVGWIVDIDKLESFMSKIRVLCLAHHAEWKEAKIDELHSNNSCQYIALCMAIHPRLGRDARINGLGSLQPELIRIIADKVLAIDVQAFKDVVNASEPRLF